MVEFPWIRQLESYPLHVSESLADPATSLIPSNAQLLYSACDSSTDSQSDDNLLLGFCELVATDSASSSLLPRLVVLCASLVPEKAHPDLNVPEAGWDICDLWETVEIDLHGILATNGIVQGYAVELKDFWESLDGHELAPESRVGETVQYRRALQELGTCFKNVGIPSSLFEQSLPGADATGSGDKRIFTFNVSNTMLFR